ncbi:TPA: beta strand repeat-containing protein, partial [Salmonella enterica]
ISGGNIDLDGSSYVQGILINNSTLAAVNNLTLNSSSVSSGSTAFNNSTATASDITITGGSNTGWGLSINSGNISATGAILICGTSAVSRGINLGAGLSGADIYINGVGGNGAVEGVYIANTAVTATDTLNISGCSTTGISLSNASLTSDTGNISLTGTATGGAGITVNNTILNATSGNMSLTGTSTTGTGVNISTGNTSLIADALYLNGSSGGAYGYILNATRGGGITDASNIYLGSAGSGKNTLNILGDNLALNTTEVQLLMSRGADSLTMINTPWLLITNNGSGDLTQDYSAARGGGWYLNGASVSVTGGGSANLAGVSFGNGTIMVDGSLNITNANAPVILTNETVTAGGDVLIDAGTATVIVNNSLINAVGNTSLITNATNCIGISIVTNSAITSSGRVVVQGGNSSGVSISSSQITAKGGVSISGSNTNNKNIYDGVNISCSTISASAGDISITGQGTDAAATNTVQYSTRNMGVNLVNSTLTSGGAVNISAYSIFYTAYGYNDYWSKVMQINNSTIAAQTLNVSANAGFPGNGAAQIISLSGVNTFDLTGGGYINATSAGKMNYTNNTTSAVTLSGTLNLLNSTNLTINGDGGAGTVGVFIQSSDITVDSSSALNVNASSSSSNATIGALQVDSPNVNGSSINISGGGGVSLCGTNSGNGLGVLFNAAISNLCVSDANVVLSGSAVNGSGVKATHNNINMSSDGSGELCVSGASENGTGVSIGSGSSVNITNVAISGSSVNNSGVEL